MINVQGDFRHIHGRRLIRERMGCGADVWVSTSSCSTEEDGHYFVGHRVTGGGAAGRGDLSGLVCGSSGEGGFV